MVLKKDMLKLEAILKEATGYTLVADYSNVFNPTQKK